MERIKRLLSWDEKEQQQLKIKTTIMMEQNIGHLMSFNEPISQYVFDKFHYGGNLPVRYNIVPFLPAFEEDYVINIFDMDAD